MGHLTRDPESKAVTGGNNVVEFGLAINRKYRKGSEVIDDPCFVDIAVWDKQGEACMKMLKTGNLIHLDGFLKFSKWEKDGENKSKLTVTATNVQFLTFSKDKEPPPF